jgi:hypothetical protein
MHENNSGVNNLLDILLFVIWDSPCARDSMTRLTKDDAKVKICLKQRK